MSRRLTRAFFVVVPAALGACNFGVPEQPDLSEVFARYEAASAALDESRAAVVADFIDEFGDDVQRLQETGQPAEVVAEAAELDQNPDTVAIDLGDFALRGNGGIRVEGRCEGIEVPPDEDTGTLAATISVRETRLVSVLSMSFEQCGFSASALEDSDLPTSFVLHGELFVDLGGDLGLNESLDGRVLTYAYRGFSTIEGETSDLNLDFQWRLPDPSASPPVPERVEVAVDVDGGTLIWFAEEGGVVGVIDRDGQWVCDFQEGFCLLEDGERRVEF